MACHDKKEYVLHRLLPLVAYCALIFFLSSREADELNAFFLFPGQDKLIHIVEYGILGVLLLRSLAPWENQVNNPGLCVFLGSLYGWSDEYHQSFVPGRESDAVDLLADFTGLAMVSLLYLAARGKRRSKEQCKGASQDSVDEAVF